VTSGRLLLELEDDTGELVSHELGPGDSSHVPPMRRHRYAGLERVELIEVSSPEIDDVVRLEDDYGREGTSAP
jgi:mannose-6-phosphate isomerase-like protein (cupin superfamily)